MMIKVSAESDRGLGPSGSDSEKRAHYFLSSRVLSDDDPRGFRSTYEISVNRIDLRSTRRLRGGKKNYNEILRTSSPKTLFFKYNTIISCKSRRQYSSLQDRESCMVRIFGKMCTYTLYFRDETTTTGRGCIIPILLLLLLLMSLHCSR